MQTGWLCRPVRPGTLPLNCANLTPVPRPCRNPDGHVYRTGENGRAKRREVSVPSTGPKAALRPTGARQAQAHKEGKGALQLRNPGGAMGVVATSRRWLKLTAMIDSG
jgi:hypothetical protein